MKVTTLILISFFLLPSAFSQNWEFVQTLGGNGNESIDALFINASNQVIIGGNFDGNFDIEGNSITSLGEEDLYCSIYDNDGSFINAFSMGGIFEDQLYGITESNDDIILYGSYNLEANFDTIQLNTSLGSKGLFITKYNHQGEVQWAQSIEANVLSIGGDIIVDESDNFIINGYFYDTLIIQQDTLISNSTEGDLFVVKMDTDGEVIWLAQAGDTGIMRATSIAIDHESNIIIGGKFKGAATFNTDAIQTNTADSDIFLAKLDSVGNFIWGKKIGGVLEEDFGDLAIDDGNNIYLAGFYIGVMSSIEGWQIQTEGLNTNAYLIKIDKDGNLVWGNSLGGFNDDFAADLDVIDDKIVVTGYYQGSTYWGFNGLFATGGFDAFVSVFDTSGTILNMLPIPGDDVELGFKIDYTSNGEIILGGAFNNNCFFDGNEYLSNGNYDVFWAKTGIQVHNNDISQLESNAFYPNPASHYIFWDNNEVSYLYDSLGRLILESESGRMDISKISNGIYFIQQEGKSHFEKIIIQH